MSTISVDGNVREDRHGRSATVDGMISQQVQ